MTGQWGEFFAIDKNKGIIYAGHEHTGCLYRFDTNGKKLSSIAYPTKESNYYLGDGAIDTNANIYLCGETLPSYTYKYNASSKKWSVLGSTVRPLTWPFAVTINKSGNLAVLDVSQQIKMYDTNGKLLKNIAIATPDFGGCLAADFSGNMYHTQFGVFSRFDSGGKKTKQRSGSNYYGIEALTADSKNRLYAISDYGFSIARLNQNGDFLAETPVSTIIKDKFLSDLSGIAVDTEFNIYIADGKEGIFKLDQNYNVVARWDWTLPSGTSKVSQKAAICLDPNNNIYAVLPKFKQIHKYDPYGNILCVWGERGWQGGKLLRPRGIAVSNDSRVYVVDADNCRVQSYSQAVNTFEVSIDRDKIPTKKRPVSVTVSFINDASAAETPAKLNILVY